MAVNFSTLMPIMPLKTPDYACLLPRSVKVLITVLNGHYCLFGVLEGSTYGIATGVRQKSINGHKRNIGP